jgi:LysR family transcriptional activator of nhaA
LLPTENTALRGSLERWFTDNGLRPRIVAEIEDGALIKDLAEDGTGFCAVPSVVAAEVKRRHRMHEIGATEDCRETVVAISAERRLTHPAVQAVTTASRDRLGG